jgi:hypothetical protein
MESVNREASVDGKLFLGVTSHTISILSLSWQMKEWMGGF